MATQATIGREVSLVITTADGTLTIPEDAVTGFEPTSRTTDLERRPLNGDLQFDHLPDGWEGTIRVDRTGPEIEAWWADTEERFFNGERRQSGIILETVREVGGGVSQYRYEGVSLVVTSLGDRGPTAYVSMTMTFRAARRRRVS